jgi:hypothetical protein
MSLNGCCDETDISTIHPMTGVGRYVQSVLLPHLSDPIPKEIEDSEEIRKFFETYKFVPYAGTTQASGHGLLKFYMKLYNLSTTHGSVIVFQARRFLNVRKTRNMIHATKSNL